MIHENVSLKKYNTFGLNVRADRLVTFKFEDNAVHYFRQNQGLLSKLMILGGGSNILFTGDYHGTLVRPEMEEITLESKTGSEVIISAGAGVIWDKLVETTVSKGLGGLENLSLIPGLVGAAPVQNIGAYGAEVRDTIQKVRAISIDDGSVREFDPEECAFGYRDSVFKGRLKGRYMITKVYFRLSANPKPCLEYGSLKNNTLRNITASISEVRQIVINTRMSKLPDPAELGNAGSFFKNPVVQAETAERMKSRYPMIPMFHDPSGGMKLAAGWLIERCGWKGKRIGDAGVHQKQALVIVNYGNATGRDLLELSEQIKKSVHEEFGINLEREVEVV